MAVGQVIILGTLFGLIVVIYALVLRFDPEGPASRRAGGAPVSDGG